MKSIIKISLSIAAGSVLFFTGCNSVPEKKTVAKPTKMVSEESLGLRKVDLYSENVVTPDETKYSKEYAGSGKTIARAFQDAPPMIPHDTEGMLPIQIDNNQCVGCHMPEVAVGMNATPIPKSHFTNFRPHHKFDGKMFEKSIDNMKNETAIQEKDTLVNARFNCSQCHAPQSEGQLVGNTFSPDFTSKDGASKSSWNGSKLTEGLDTILGE
ncbi:nitrate reductase cytochrome c-type subunit [Poseidonibacter sp.]|uniref:nitrate reductase cytochrome c-type subunit n=1 Tax=Poseidonibacter sp. TaxID=2321188 RepID=UPI003C733D2A